MGPTINAPPTHTTMAQQSCRSQFTKLKYFSTAKIEFL